jgi:protein-disulfide isomerase/uncharacterized membrane protein
MGKSPGIKNKNPTNNKPHESVWRSWFVIIAAMAGLGVCLYLYSFHISLLAGKIKTSLLCGSDSGLGCNSVSASPYSSMLGLPLASWGAIFYVSLGLLGLGSLIFRRDCGQAFLRWAFFLAVFGLAFDLYLAHIMIFRIRALCWLCIATYVINFAIIVGLIKQIWRAPEPRIPLLSIFPGTADGRAVDSYYRNVIKGLLISGILLTIVVGAAGSRFLSGSLTGNDRERLAKITENLVKQTPKSIEVKNRPFTGSEDADLTVVEFSDFRCPYCARAARYLKLAGSGNHDKARFVFRHYPLDKACNPRLNSNMHPGACLLAEGAACAHEQNKFWAYHDIAFETSGKITRQAVVKIASKLGMDLRAFESCLASGRGLLVVNEDIKAAFDAGVKGTPTIFINGRILRGVPKPWIINEILKFSEGNLSPAR